MKKALLGLFLSIGLTIILTFPSILSLGSHFIGDGGDNYEFAGYQGLVVQNISEGKLPFSTTNFWRYPVGFDFSRGFDSYLSVSLGAILYPIFDFPLSFNLTILILLSLNGFFSFLFFQKLTKSFWLGALGMLIYGFSFYSLAKAGSHPNLLFTGFIPLLGIGILNLVENSEVRKKDIFFIFSILVLIALGSAQYAILTGIFLVILILISYLVFPKTLKSLAEKTGKHFKFIVMMSGTSIIFLSIFFAPHIISILNGSFSLANREEILHEFTPSFSDFFLPNKYLNLIFGVFPSLSNPSIEKVVYIGWVEILAFLAFFLAKIPKKGKIFLGLLVSIPLLFALGYGKDNSLPFLPYKFISEIFPFKLIAEPGRYFVMFYFFITISIVILMDTISNKKLRAFVIALLILIVFAERLPSSFYKTESLKDQYTETVRAQDTKAVLDIPVSYYYPKYDTLSMYYKKPIVNGYFHWSADSEFEKMFIAKNGLISRYICDENDPVLTQIDETLELHKDFAMLSELKQNGIKTLVVHKDDKYFHSVCDNVRIRLSRLIPSETTLEKTPEDKQKQLTAESDGIPNYSFYLPYSGKLFLDGSYLANIKPVKFVIEQNGKPVNFAHSWDQKDKTSIELNPKNNIVIQVSAGDTISIKSNRDAGHTWLSLWYRYVPENNIIKIKDSPIEKIYEDEKAAVYKLN